MTHESHLMKTLRQLALVGVIVGGLLSILATSSGGGGGSGGGVSSGPTLADLAGTWFGTLEDPSGDLHTISLTIDGSGNLTQESIDSVDTGRAGTIKQTSGSIFSFTLSDGTVGEFIADASVTHAGYLDQFFNSGVVQKGASSLPTYVSTDIVDNWSGFGLALDSAFNVVQKFNSNAAVASDLSFTETNSSTGTTTGMFTAPDPDFGLATGTYANPSSTGVTEAFLSPDKSFAAVWNCDTTDGSVSLGFPDDCFFFAYTGTVTVTFDLRDFTEISVPTPFNVTVTQGPDFSVEVTVDADVVQRVDVTQTGSRLNIALLPGDSNIETLDAFVTMPVLNRIDLTGVVNATLNDFNQSQMTVNVGGVSRLRGNALMIGDLSASVSGVSLLDFGDIRPLGNANIDVSGVSQATLNMDVGRTLTGSVTTGQGTGASILFYYGTNVTVNVTTDFLSRVVKLGETRP